MMYIDTLKAYIKSLLESMGASSDLVYIIKGFVFVVLIVVLCILVNWLAKHLILALVRGVIKRSSNKWDDVFLEKKVFHRLSHLAPASVIYWLGPAFMAEYPKMVNFTYLATNLYIIFTVMIVFYAFLDAIRTIYETFDISKSKPIKGYAQVLKIISGGVAIIFMFSEITGKTPVFFLGTLGAATAILLLIFKDTILGFVGGVQVTANNLVQIGDWIEMPKYGADGDVIDITLHTVLVQNFDRTITTIPTYALVSDSFKNWRGMVQTGGRRIKRSVHIDIRSIKFCDEEMLQRFETIYYLKDYIRKKREEIDRYNKSHDFDPGNPVNGRRMTNLGTFRAYITHYLLNHPGIHKDLITMVRQMPPGENGVPLEIYTFTNDIAWKNYEGIQSDIFDHILSVVPFFDLKVFQHPTEFYLPGMDALGKK